MTTKKGGGNKFTNKFERMGHAGGNHTEKGKDAVLNKGRESLQGKGADAQGKDKSAIEANRFDKIFKHFEPPAKYEDIKAKLDKHSKDSPEKEK